MTDRSIITDCQHGLNSWAPANCDRSINHCASWVFHEMSTWELILILLADLTVDTFLLIGCLMRFSLVKKRIGALYTCYHCRIQYETMRPATRAVFMYLSSRLSTFRGLLSVANQGFFG